ncbi:nucleoporin p54-like isoform X1 [Hydractinia symbiolongicarpus]|uniref:nucleoporin p54-like isoform X1 n=1 Tax=Hydractinia symbiolongicarpus TaxID=13093 RepID=UPI00254D1B0D|nr:nucleoporin p54-like isoform X1 [Hydractinia symbiolongicarpus]
MAFSLGGNLGAATSTPAFSFGAAKTTAPALFGGLGSNTTAGFGQSSGTTTFGTTTTTASALFGGLGAQSTTSTGFGGFTGFGAKTTSSGFGGFGFGTTTTSAGTGFGSTSLIPGFGAKSTATGFGLTTTQPTWSMGQQSTQQQQQVVENPLAIMTSALTMPTLFGDERDSIIAKLNQLQALWGQGKAYYANAPPIPFGPENPFSRFKSIGYSCLPTAKDSDGFVSLDLKHKEGYIKENQQQLVEALHKCLGSKPTLSVCVDGVRSLPSDRSEVVIYVVERQTNGSTRRILATELYAFLSQDNIKNQLKTMGVENLVAKTTFTESQLKQFLDTPPLCIDAILWEQAKKDNPDPATLIPVPMLGFNELLTRLKHQQYQNTQHERRLDLISEEIDTLQKSHSTTIAKLAQYKRKHLELGHRVLEVMINLESSRKIGYAIEPSEEQLRIQLESLQAELNAPMQFKGRLNELMSQIRLQSQINNRQSSSAYSLDEHIKVEIKQHLTQQQNGLLQLISIIKDDFEDLKIIENGVMDSIYQPRR